MRSILIFRHSLKLNYGKSKDFTHIYIIARSTSLKPKFTFFVN